MTSILVVDDSVSMRKAVKYALEGKEDYQLTDAEDGQHAIDLIDHYRVREGKTYNLILADINMPNMGGYEMVEKIRNMPDYRFTPILFLTTENSEQSKQRGRALNATGWVNKPFSPDTLLNVVQQVMSKVKQ